MRKVATRKEEHAEYQRKGGCSSHRDTLPVRKIENFLDCKFGLEGWRRKKKG